MHSQPQHYIRGDMLLSDRMMEGLQTRSTHGAQKQSSPDVDQTLTVQAILSYP
jgi:hypothetical protein